MYEIGNKEKKQYSSLILLSDMITNSKSYSVILDEDDKYLEPIIIEMLSQDFVEVNDTSYIPTLKGKEYLKKFNDRYVEFLRVFDLFCCVDLESGEFAFSKFFEYNDNKWSLYLNEERWEDCRIAVAIFKDIDPKEIVFMSFVNEGRFNLRKTGWQFDLSSGLIWDEILEICNNALTPEDIGDDAMEDMITQGCELMLELLKREEEMAEKELEDEVVDDDDDETYLVFVEEEVYDYDYDYYYAYNDPYYVSPVWGRPWRY